MRKYLPPRTGRLQSWPGTFKPRVEFRPGARSWAELLSLYRQMSMVSRLGHIGRRKQYRSVIIADWHDEETGEHGSDVSYRYRQIRGRPVLRRFYSPASSLHIYVSGSIYEEEYARWVPAWWWQRLIQERRRKNGENPFRRPIGRRHALQR